MSNVPCGRVNNYAPDISIPKPRNCEYVICNMDFVAMIKLGVLIWEHYPGYLSGFSVIKSVLIRGTQGEPKEKEMR